MSFIAAVLTTAEVVPDGLACFGGVMAAGNCHCHDVIAKLGGKGVAEHTVFRAVITLLSNLKTSIAGTCHFFKLSLNSKLAQTKRAQPDSGCAP